MGQEILYCFKCQERVTSSDLESANALRFGNRTACHKCVPDLLASLTSQERKDLVSRVQSPKKPATARGLAPATPRPKVYGVDRSSSNPAILWAIGGVIVVLVIVGAVLMSKSEPSPPPREASTPLPVPKGPEESPRERSAREAIAKAKSLPSSDPDAQLAAFEQALKTAAGTSREREARELRDEFLSLRRKALVKELSGLDERARVHVQKEEFGAALAIFEAVRPLRPGAEWKGLVDGKVDEIRKAVDAAYVPLRDQAVAARARSGENEVNLVRERIRSWGLADRLADLDAHLRNVAPPPPADPWLPLFDGKTLDFLVGGGEGAWKVENGAIVHVKDKGFSAQSRRLFTDGELRIRFEWRALTSVGFAIRQGADGAYGVFLDRAQLGNMEGKEHEFILIFKGPEVTATLDGKPWPVEAQGKKPLKGALQFNCMGESLTIRSIEYRDDRTSEGLVGHWTFDDGKAADASGSGNHGTAVDGPVSGPGKIGGALVFDGRRAHVTVPSSPSLTVTGPLTVAAWVNPRTPADPPQSRAIAEKWESQGLAYSGYFLRISSKGNAHFVVSEPTRISEITSTKPLVPETWSHVAAVYDGSSLKMYVHGTLEKTIAASNGPAPSQAVLRIGKGGGGGGHNFLGSLDDVRVYNRALSAEEIARFAAR